jgi:hypothetical protein
VSDVSGWVGFAGIIAGGFIAISGQITSARLASKTAEGTIAADRNQRLWERRAGAYVDMVQDVLARRTRREALTSRGDIGNIQDNPRRELYDVAEAPEHIRLRAVLRAYASPEVWTATGRADTANSEFWISLIKLQSANSTNEERRKLQQAGAAEDELPPDPRYQDRLNAMYAARRQARAADDALFDVINSELSWRPIRQPRKSWKRLLGLLRHRRRATDRL